MEIKANKCRNNLVLGIQTPIGNVQFKADWLARQWAPRRAKSFTIQSLIHTDYHGMPVDSETGYARVEVAYYTTQKEGKFRLAGENCHGN